MAMKKFPGKYPEPSDLKRLPHPPLASTVCFCMHGASSTAISRAVSADESSSFTRRLIAAVVALACASILAMAAWMTPSPSGLGTHRVLNLPPCGWIAVADLPCPTCGMTTAFAHAANGNLLGSIRAQPLGAALAIACAIALLVSLHVLLTGSRLGAAFTRLWNRRTAWALSAFVVLAWGYKVLSYKGLL